MDEASSIAKIRAKACIELRHVELHDPRALGRQRGQRVFGGELDVRRESIEEMSSGLDADAQAGDPASERAAPGRRRSAPA